MDYYKLGVVCGILFGLIIVAVVVLILKGSGGKGRLFSFDYDERQQAARGKAFKWAFIVLAVFLVLDGLLEIIYGTLWADRLTGNFVGLLLALAVFAVQCIMRDAYFAISEKPRSVLIFVGCVTVLNAISSVMAFLSGNSLLEDGLVTFHAINPLCTVILLTILIACVIRRSRTGEDDAGADEQ